MGRIKSLMIKKAAKQLLQSKDVETSFTTNFDQNKIVLRNGTLPSKPMRNKVAGYISRLVRMRISPRQIKPKQEVRELPARYHPF